MSGLLMVMGIKTTIAKELSEPANHITGYVYSKGNFGCSAIDAKLAYERFGGKGTYDTTDQEFIGYDADGFVKCYDLWIKNYNNQNQYIYKFEGSNKCHLYGEQFDNEGYEFYRKREKFNPVYYGRGGYSKCDQSVIKEGRFQIEFIPEVVDQKIKVFQIRSIIKHNRSEVLDKIEVSRDVILSMTNDTGIIGKDTYARIFIDIKNKLGDSDEYEIGSDSEVYLLPKGSTSKIKILHEKVVNFVLDNSQHYGNRVQHFLIQKNTAERIIRDLYENERVGGYDGEMLYPNEQINRAEIASLIVIAFDINRENLSGNNFPDVDPNNPSYNDILALKNMGVLTGKTGGNYEPDSYVTRGEMVSMIIRTMESMGFDFDILDKLLENADKKVFSDVGTEIHSDNIMRLANLKFDESGKRVVNGYSDNSFKSDRFINRHEASTIAKQGQLGYILWLQIKDPTEYSKYL